MYEVLYKMKKLTHIILKMNVKTVKKSQCCRLVNQAVAGKMCGKE